VSKVGRITPEGAIKEFPVAGGPFGITTGADGALWFTERFSSDRDGLGARIGRITTTGALTEFQIGSVGGDITTGPNGDLWFTEPFANKIGRITTQGVVTEYPIPTSASRPEGITAGPDGNVWFAEQFGNRIGRITPAGVITEIHVPTPDSGPTGITTGPDGKLWFTEQFANQIGVLDPATVKPPPRPCLVVTRSTELDHDIGPCPGDGIVVTANDITLDLGGHRVSGTPQRLGDFAGVRLAGVHGVTVRGGTVSGFDAGVFVDQGSANTVTNMTLRDNLGAPEGASTLGDGIVLFHSAGNRIVNNDVVHNGPFDGIGVLGLGSDHNRIEANLVEANTDDNASGVLGGGVGVIVNPFLETEDVRRGESLVGNDVIGNVIRHNTSSGSSNLSNLYATIRDNLVEHNGFRANGEVNDPANGIGIQHLFMAQPDTYDLVTQNLVHDNANDGIQVSSEVNRIISNTSTGNGNLDLADYNDFSGGRPCDSNVWFDNV
ncbi:MAG: right-handed parallel beta-helix repeat-containing protein, partial [Actinobacteria bacterium]|nr:right-handed parallel beta-helix repeat-containing protein [Actinomycetota bacterium]